MCFLFQKFLRRRKKEKIYFIEMQVLFLLNVIQDLEIDFKRKLMPFCKTLKKVFLKNELSILD